MSTLSSPHAITLFQFATTVEALWLETRGMRKKGHALLPPFKKRWGYHGNKAAVVEAARADKLAFRQGRLDDITSGEYRRAVDQFLASPGGSR